MNRSGLFRPRLPLGLAFCIGFFGLDPARAQEQDIAAKAASCAVCHGEKGVPISKEIPVIWGQYAGYIFIELRDFARGSRKSDVMTPVAKSLGREDMMALGAYFEQKPWPDLGQKRAPPEVAQHAEAIAVSGQCTQCHLGGFVGDGTNPRLAGQSETYLRQTMTAFHTGERSNNPWMVSLLKTYTEADIDALATYLGGL